MTIFNYTTKGSCLPRKKQQQISIRSCTTTTSLSPFLNCVFSEARIRKINDKKKIPGKHVGGISMKTSAQSAMPTESVRFTAAATTGVM